MPRLTKAFVASLRPDPARDVVVWDTELRGFGVRLKPSGRGAFIVQYRNEARSSRRLTIGAVGTLTLDEARKLARVRLADVAHGSDPAEVRHEAREAVTVAELCELYLEAARARLVTTRFGRPKRDSTIQIDEGRVYRHVVPLIGRKIATNLTRADVQRMVDDIAAGKTAVVAKTRSRGKAVVRGGAGVAGRVVEMLGGIWNWAELRGLVSGQNPCRGVEKQRGVPKDRTLSHGELARLGAVLKAREETHPQPCAAVRLIALTGLRREEAVRVRWSEIDEPGSCLRLELTKTGRSTRPIGRRVLELLAGLPRRSEWVFSNLPGTGAADLKKSIADLFDAAGLRDARSHDLRRTFASVAADLDYSDATIGELLGHARRGVTVRHYIRRPDAALVAAANKVADEIALAMEGA